jgi:hypothetical protein
LRERGYQCPMLLMNMHYSWAPAYTADEKSEQIKEIILCALQQALD